MENRNTTEKKNKKILILIILLILIFFTSITVTVVLLVNNSKPVVNTDLYPPVSEDPDAVPVEEGDTTRPALENPKGGGAVSLTYSKQASASKGDGIADILFQNPAKSNQSIVIQLQITDMVLIEKLGKTGRAADDKAKIEDADDYDIEKSRMIIAESGLLKPGYKLSTLQLKALPDGTVLPKGNYNAFYYILAYDKGSHERAIVNMQIPITLTIDN
ncbi:MAG: hypothetical protein PHR14_07475 [Oscillospiraceae bacterium]|nr:hypothetical protein [Oscillospiraceae bacterium]